MLGSLNLGYLLNFKDLCSCFVQAAERAPADWYARSPNCDKKNTTFPGKVHSWRYLEFFFGHT